MISILLHIPVSAAARANTPGKRKPKNKVPLKAAVRRDGRCVTHARSFTLAPYMRLILHYITIINIELPGSDIELPQ